MNAIRLLLGILLYSVKIVLHLKHKKIKNGIETGEIITVKKY